jgi:hypothetical protein
MDALQHWSGLYFEVEAVSRFLADYKNQFRRNIKYLGLEIILPFILFLIRDQKKSYRIGIPTLLNIKVNKRITLTEVFNRKIWLDEDFDLLLAPEGDEQNKYHKIQIVRFAGDEQGSTEGLSSFLEEKKFNIIKDEKLLLLVLLDKELKLKYFELSQKLKETNVPYGQIFILGTRKVIKTDVFFCFQIYPEVKTLGELTPSTIKY